MAGQFLQRSDENRQGLLGSHDQEAAHTEELAEPARALILNPRRAGPDAE